MKRIENIIGMLEVLPKQDENNWRIALAKGKYKLPTTIKGAVALGKRFKRQRKYGNNDNKA